MGGRRGRPKKEETKKELLIVRIDDDEKDMIEYLSEMSGMSKSEIVRKGMRMLYNLEKYR